MSRRSKKKQTRTGNNTEIAKTGTTPPSTQRGVVDRAANVTARLSSISVSKSYEGPLPPPEILADFERIVPGCAEKIIDQFIVQGNHRMSLESYVIHSDSRRANLGLISGLVLTLTCLGGSFYIILQGYEVTGITAAITSLAALVGVFVYGSKSRKDERIEKTKLLAGK